MVMKDNENLRKEKIAEEVYKNDIMAEVHKINATKKTSPIIVDGLTDDDEICSLFSDKYNTLYNNIPYYNLESK